MRRIDCWQVSRPGVRYFSKKALQAAQQAIGTLVLDPAVLDRDAQEELAVALRVPAEVVVDVRVTATGFGVGERMPEVFLDLGAEGRHPPVVDDVLEPGPLAVGAVAEVAKDLEHGLADLQDIGRGRRSRAARPGRGTSSARSGSCPGRRRRGRCIRRAARPRRSPGTRGRWHGCRCSYLRAARRPS